MKIVNTENLLNYCLKRKKSLTPSRNLVIKTLAKFNKPITAYELRDVINNNGVVNINISQVYRVLEFWIDLRLVHKISSINKFVLCTTPEEKHTHMLNICTVCEKVVETCNKRMGLNFKKSTAKLDLAFNNTRSVEIPVICRKCS